MATSSYSRETLLVAWELLSAREASLREACPIESRVGGFRPAQLMSFPCKQGPTGQVQTVMAMVRCTSYSTRRTSWPVRREANIKSRDADVRGPRPDFERNDSLATRSERHYDSERPAKHRTLDIIVQLFERDRLPCRRLCALCLSALQRLAPGMQIELVRRRTGLLDLLPRIMEYHSDSLLVNDHVARLINTLRRFSVEAHRFVLKSKIPEQLTTTLASDLFDREEDVQQVALRCLSRRPKQSEAASRVLQRLESLSGGGPQVE